MFSFKGKKPDDASVAQISVCLIGCGPAGMNFLHAVAERKAKGLAVPQVTCFESADSPGGIWRDIPDDDKERKRPENVPVVYEDMWCNSPKELMEYYDYTFADHFKRPTPAYLPRKDIMEYLLARNNKNGELDDVKYSHTVTEVEYDNEAEKFTIIATDRATGKSSTIITDKCIWSGGINVKPFKPPYLMDMLKDFKGKVMHSAEATDNFGKDVEGKRVLIIGDARSAEDLSLRAIKSGVEHVYVCARSGDGEASSTNAWPRDKVTIIYGPPYKVVKGNSFKCQGVYWSAKRQNYRRDDEEDVTKVSNIDTVIMCTGYDPCLSLLPDELQFDVEGEWTISPDWQMEANPLTVSIGNPTPNEHLSLGSTCYPDVYRGCLMTNPNMMYIHETEDTLSPIIETDVLAWLLLGFIAGEVPIPKEKEMRNANQKQLEAEMNVPWLRAEMDSAYGAALDDLPGDHWCNDSDDERGIILDKMRVEFMVSRMARDATDCRYPVNFGKFNDLSEKGKQLVAISYADIGARTTLPNHDTNTYRDNNQKDFRSIHTGEQAVALPAPWINLSAPDGLPTKLDTVVDQS